MTLDQLEIKKSSFLSLMMGAVTLCMLGNFAGFCLLQIFFKINFFQKIILGIPPECLTV